MKFHSTNYNSEDVDFKTAILQGQALDNGLYMLNKIPKITEESLDSFKNMNFIDIALFIISKFIGDIISEEKLKRIVNIALNFEVPIEKPTNLLIVYIDGSQLTIHHSPLCRW